MKLKKIAALLTVAGFAAPAFATNGMNMEGYGPVATGMGGASMAYDNGTAGLINNPATLGLMKSGTSRFDIALGGLHPKVSTSAAGAGTKGSAGDAYYMPAVGYVRKDGNWTWGVGMMSQGGMGTEYGTNSFLSTAGASVTNLAGIFGAGAAVVTGAQTTTANGLGNRSELGLGRVLFPLVYSVSDSVTIGGTVDFVWGGLDLQSVADGNTFTGMITNSAGSTGSGCIQRNTGATGAACGTMMTAFGNFVGAGAGQVSGVQFAHFDFSKGTDKFSQAATTTGWGGNIGMTWKATPNLSLGAVYHAKTKLNDMTGSGQMRMNVLTVGGPAAGTTATMQGKFTVVNFQWPETIGFGLSYKATDRLQVVADYKSINWSQTMKNLHMAFTASSVDVANFGALVGTRVDAYFNQNWRDQNVFQIGMSYKMDDALTLRLGANISDSPIPSGSATGLVHPLFPAIVQNHYTMGLGYAIDKSSSVDFSASIAPNTSGQHRAGFNTSMSQQNWQVMFSQRF